ncbi:putative disease resistance RPP13-like protein 1 [Neltuma alba]|uniref:putative disease resistance RPP13-like protein 1 n=1 Tax=Neltuma alba TaxID=207710 RepID=UPI0010A36708|nr:putative disease resistance RPP13-like protein 1 [Prosopis alba]
MAASLVGGALLSAVFNVFLERLTPELADMINFICGKKLDDKLLHHLKPSLIAARAVLRRFLQPSKGNMALEDAGHEYFEDLTLRSFFQPLPISDLHFLLSYKTRDGPFVMHDLIHELAPHVAGDFYLRLGEKGNKIGHKTRHLSCNFQNYPYLDHDVLQKSKGLRTFIGLNFSYIPRSIGNSSHILLSNLKCLQMLSLRDLSALKILPESIGKFIHLHYLDLSETCVESLPNSIDTPLKAMPRGLGNIKDLQFLSDFVVGREQEASIGELGEISNLKGIIKISKLENVKNGNEACDARMMEKKHIKSLTSSCAWYDDVEDTRTERDILGNLQPYCDLEELEIHHYRGTIFPDWTAAPNRSPTSKDLALSQAGENVRRKAACFFKKASHLGVSVA